VLVEIRTKQVESSEQVKNVLVADKLATCFGLNQNAIEFVEPALRNHVDVGQHLVTLRISNQIYVEAFGMEHNPGFHICWHWISVLR
jgi:hypothetical protein